MTLPPPSASLTSLAAGALAVKLVSVRSLLFCLLLLPPLLLLRRVMWSFDLLSVATAACASLHGIFDLSRVWSNSEGELCCVASPLSRFLNYTCLKGSVLNFLQTH